MFNVIDRSTGWKMDFIIRKSRPFSEEEFRRRARVNLHGVPLFLASAEDIVIAKLEWSKLAQSQRQIDDVAAILRARPETFDRSYTESWVTELHLNEEWEKARIAAGT
jgi:hypothetical protein